MYNIARGSGAPVYGAGFWEASFAAELAASSVLRGRKLTAVKPRLCGVSPFLLGQLRGGPHRSAELEALCIAAEDLLTVIEVGLCNPLQRLPHKSQTTRVRLELVCVVVTAVIFFTFPLTRKEARGAC